ncbi:EsaB/YukD family protein [Nocardioides nematodiphilus]|uniref:EsaB/YukD family protein n=1 Tax=Nocardioides nematodiphilus TaxID=2849669 RepID=UPI001CDA430C|nr:EsaB/YukD family protein [Nocardioides nematodiphilus]MCA1981772.1 EsaB/YukD family protein [Nocardioides nematodiphilus]
MADLFPAGLVRITVAAGERRVDLAVPGAVPVAELIGDLARDVGLLDATTAHRGYALTRLDGRRLAPETGLQGQGVADGSILTLTTGVAPPAPRRYDDPVEALADSVAREHAGRAVALAHAGAAVAGGTLLGIVLGRGLPMPGHGVAVSLASLLVGVVLGRGLFPRLALALSGAPGGASAGAGAAEARRAYAILTALTIAAGVILVGAAPFVATLGRSGTCLAATACLAVLVGAVRPHSGRGERLLDLGEAILLAALVPLFVLAGGLLDRLPV